MSQLPSWLLLPAAGLVLAAEFAVSLRHPVHPSPNSPSRPPLLSPLCRGAITGKDAGVEELVLAEKIIAHLIKREQVRLRAAGVAQQDPMAVQAPTLARRATPMVAPACSAFLTPTTAPTEPNPPSPSTLRTRLQVLLVVEQPERQADEAAADYAKRLQNDRVLALNPNYAAE